MMKTVIKTSRAELPWKTTLNDQEKIYLERKRIVKATAWSVALYGVKTWTITIHGVERRPVWSEDMDENTKSSEEDRSVWNVDLEENVEHQLHGRIAPRSIRPMDNSPPPRWIRIQDDGPHRRFAP